MAEERRRFIRVSAKVLTFYKIVSTGKVRRVLTSNIGGGGLSFGTETLLEPGTRLEVEMKLPDREGPIMFTADVVWSRLIEGATGPLQDTTAETGVRIVTIDPKDQKFLLQYAVVNAPPPEHV